MTIADDIATAGTKCGKNLLEATEDMCDASGSAGPGMAFAHQREIFEQMLDTVCDGLRFYGHYADAARTLFLASARIEFYGVHASESQQKLCREQSWEAYHALSQAEAA